MMGQAFALVRYTILARLIGPEQLGLAALLILTSQFLENVSDTGGDRFLVQDRDGDRPEMLGLVHLAMGLRGMLMAVSLLALSIPVALFFKAPSLESSLAWLAVVPLIGGFVNYDMRRAQRTGDFRPEGMTIIISEAAALIGTAVAAWFLRDHTAVLYGLGLRAAAMVVTSHVMAKQPYRWSYSRGEAGRFAAFAAPLALNGVLLFATSQGDRLIIGGMVGPEALGYYSAILLLISSPLMALAKFLMTMHLPMLSAARERQAEFDTTVSRLGGRATMVALAAAAGFTLVGPLVTFILYGEKFLRPAVFFALLAVLQSARFVRFWPNTVALSIGKSSVVTITNLARLVAVPFAILSVVTGVGLDGVVAAFIGGEIIALLVGLYQLGRARAMHVDTELVRSGLMLALFLLIIGWAWAVQTDYWLFPPLAFATAFCAATIIRRERKILVDSVNFLKRRLGRR